MDTLTQIFANGLSVGSVYALMAIAMVIVYKTSEVLNFAQGDIGMIATFVAYVIVASAGYPFWIALPAALAFAAVLGVAFEFFVIRRAKEPTVLNLLIMTLGFQLVLYGMAGWKWGAEQRRIPIPISDQAMVAVGPISLTHLNLATLAAATIVLVAMGAFFRFTKLGIAMKATQQNPVAARINGIRTKRILAFAFALNAIIGAVAALLIAPVTTLDPGMMLDPLLKGFAGAVLGGMTTLAGAAAGGYLVGILENAFGAYVSVEFKTLVALVVIVAVLWFRPSGLFGHHYVRKV
jgi:branched-chain amino acid transport system permease protein